LGQIDEPVIIGADYALLRRRYGDDFATVVHVCMLVYVGGCRLGIYYISMIKRKPLIGLT